MNDDYEVKCYSGKTRLQSELKAAFELVANKTNWKLPIDAKVQIKPGINRELITDAIVHFAGCVPTYFHHYRRKTGAWLLVQAEGYYRAVGA